MPLEYTTAGESHGPQSTAIITGLPAGLPLGEEEINRDLARRQIGYGRGDRQKIERDRARICSGVRFGKTLASPLALVIENRDWSNWTKVMSVSAEDESDERVLTRPRPGHADLPGVMKWHQDDSRNILERASARATAAQVAVGAVAKRLLDEFGMAVIGHVVNVGGVTTDCSALGWAEIRETAESSPLRVGERSREDEMKAVIDRAKEKGDTVGGVFEVIVTGVPVGLGSCMESTKRLDGLLAGALMAVNAIKGVEIGMGFEVARRPGSQVHDAIYFDRENDKDYLDGHGPTGGYYRKTNHAGGTEGGITNGEPIVARAAMKPIPTLVQPLPSVDFKTKEAFEAAHERSDTCAVPAAAVVGEAVVAITMARAFLDKFRGDHVDDLRAAYDGYVRYLDER